MTAYLELSRVEKSFLLAEYAYILILKRDSVCELTDGHSFRKNSFVCSRQSGPEAISWVHTKIETETLWWLIIKGLA